MLRCLKTGSRVSLICMATPSSPSSQGTAFMHLKRGADEQSVKLHDYVVSKSYRANAALDTLQEDGMQLSIGHIRGGMVSPPDSIPILQLLIKLTQARIAIEVGVFTGYTTLGIALSLPEGGNLHALDISEEYANVGKPLWKEAGAFDKIKLHIGPALLSLQALEKELPPESVDFAFIDADKSNYVNYYEQLMKMLRRGGVIVVDNVLWNGNVIDPSDTTEETKGIRAINDRLYHDERVTIAMLKNSDGITVAMKN